MPLLPTLLIYRNDPSVLLGRNQNPWQECAVDWCRSQGIAILRRLSGGGTVFHDHGNLNYAFIVPRSDYDQRHFLQIILDALAAQGIGNTRISEHFSAWVNAHKIAGTAFALSGKAALLHGCILVNTDLARLHLALRQDPREHFLGATVASVRVPVVNVSTLNNAITADSLQEAIVGAARTRGGNGPAVAIGNDHFSQDGDFAAAVAKFRSDAWTYERSADFTLERCCAAGTVSLDVSLGRIRQAVLRRPTGGQNLPQFQGLPLLDAYPLFDRLPEAATGDSAAASASESFP